LKREAGFITCQEWKTITQQSLIDPEKGGFVQRKKRSLQVGVKHQDNIRNAIASLECVLCREIRRQKSLLSMCCVAIRRRGIAGALDNQTDARSLSCGCYGGVSPGGA
jgi:hypothetical protein